MANAGHYAEIVGGCAKQRRLMDLGHRLLQAAAEPSAQPEAVARHYARQVLEVAAPTPSPAKDRPAGPTLAPEALYGLAGDVVRAFAPHTEADPAGLLANTLTGFGNMVGPGPHALVGRTRHPAKLYAAIVGPSGKGRKGTARAEIRPLLEQADPDWGRRCIASGLASGEGLMHRLRDEVRDAKGEITEAGTADKRLLVVEAEFARVLAVAGRDSSTLSMQLRDFWDSDRAQSLAKNDPMVASGTHVSMLVEITCEELLRRLTETEGRNGFANRYLYWYVRRAQYLPHGGRLDPRTFDELAERVGETAKQARKIRAMHRSPDANEYWDLVYPELEAETEEGGLAAAVTDRGAAQTLRLSVVYALLDGSAMIDLPHLQAAYAVWRYCEASALEIFGDALGDEVADQLLEHLQAAGEQGLSLREQNGLFHGHVSSERLAGARARLLRARRGLTLRESLARLQTGTAEKAEKGSRRPRFTWSDALNFLRKSCGLSAEKVRRKVARAPPFLRFLRTFSAAVSAGHTLNPLNQQPPQTPCP